MFLIAQNLLFIRGGKGGSIHELPDHVENGFSTIFGLIFTCKKVTKNKTQGNASLLFRTQNSEKQAGGPAPPPPACVITPNSEAVVIKEFQHKEGD